MLATAAVGGGIYWGLAWYFGAGALTTGATYVTVVTVKTASVGVSLLAGKAAATGGAFLATKTVATGASLLAGKAAVVGSGTFLSAKTAATGATLLAGKTAAVATAAGKATLLEEILFGINCLSKAFSVIETTIDIHEVVNSRELTQSEKAHRVATCVLFAVLQTVDLGAGLFTSSSTVKIGTKIGAGTSHFLKEGSKKSIQDEFSFSDLLDMLSLAAFRGGDIAGFMVSELPSQYKNLKDSADLLQATALLGMNRQSVLSALRTITHWASAKKKEVPSQTLDNRYKQELKEVIDAASIRDFNLIPAVFLSDPKLNKWVCPITKKPIRHAAVIDVTKNTTQPIVYEKSAILTWIQENPRRRPPRWPEKVPVREHRVVSSQPIQSFIDDSLQLLLDGVKELALDLDLENCTPI